MIAPTRYPGPHPDRELDCQMAAEEAFLALVDAIKTAGWDRTEAAAALNARSWNYMLALKANAEAEAAIATASLNKKSPARRGPAGQE
jgi:hypothetical protein